MHQNDRRLLETILGRNSGTNSSEVDEYLKPSHKSDVEQFIAMNNVLSTIKALELEKVHEAVDRAKPEIDKLVEQLRSEDATVKKVLRAKKKKKTKYDPKGVRGGKAHWRARRKVKLAYRREKEYARSKFELSEKIKKGGWYKAYEARWKRRGSKRLGSSAILTQKEWSEYIDPLLGNNVQPLVKRIDPLLGFILTNILVFNRKTGELLFDGTDLALARTGQVILTNE